MKGSPNTTNRVLLTVADAVEATSLSRSTIYEMIKSGELPTVKVGKRRLVPAVALQAWADSLTQRAVGRRGTRQDTRAANGNY